MPRQSVPTPSRWRAWLAAALLAAAAGCGQQVGPSVQEQYLRAVDYEARGQHSAAVLELKNVLQREPQHAKARYLLGRCHLELGDGVNAEKELELAREMGYEGPELSLGIMRAWVLAGEYRKVLDKLQDVEPGHSLEDLLLLRGEANLGLGQLNQAKRAFLGVIERDPGSAKARLGLTQVALAQRNTAEAERQLDIALDARPDDRTALLLKGELTLARSDFEAALAVFEKAMEGAPNSVAARLGAARALIGLQRTEAAEEHLEFVYAKSAENPYVKYLRALVARQKNDLDKAQEMLGEVLAVAPEHPPSVLLMASIYYIKGQYGYAEGLLRQFTATVPGYLPARKLLAAVQLKLEEPEKAVQTLLPAADPGVKDSVLLSLLGTAYANAGQVGKGTEFLEKAARETPDNLEVRTQLAANRLAEGDAGRAIDELKALAGRGPGLTRADRLLVLAYMQRRDWERALGTANLLAQKFPDEPEAYNLLAGAYEGNGDVDSARRFYAKALEVSPGYGSAAMNLARLDLAAGDRAAAHQRFLDIMKASEDDPEAYIAAALRLAELELHDGDVEGARLRFNAVLSRSRDNPDALVGLARLVNEGLYSEFALKYLERAREANPRALQPRLLLAEAYLRREEKEKALAVASEARRIAPDSQAALAALGRAQLAVTNPGGALATFKEMVDRFPESAAARYELAMAQLRLQNPEGARTQLEKAVALSPNHVAAKLYLGKLDLKTGNPDSALALARELQSEHPEAAAGYTLEGEILLAGGKPGDAAAAFRQAVERSEDTATRLNLYQALSLAGQPQAATRVLQEWLEAHPGDLTTRLVLASDRLRAGDRDSALVHYDRVLRSQPENTLALNNLAWIYHDRDDPRAVSLARQAYELEPDRPEFMDTYGWVLLQRGHLATGHELLDKAVRQVPGNPTYLYHRAVSYVKLGDLDRAREEFETLRKRGDDFPERGKIAEWLEILPR